jgi:hypothetical protein
MVSLDTFALLACLASTLFMAGVIGVVQVVHYPLFDEVGREEFERYHAEHCRLMGYVVGLPMVVELFSSIFLVVSPPEGVSLAWPWAGLAMAIVSWGTTGFVSVPLHDKLARGFDAWAHRRLVATNWIRFLSWNAHALIALAMTAVRLAKP